MKHKAIYTYNMTGVCWQLLWWLIVNMDEDAKVYGGWRQAAAKDIGRDRVWIGRCAKTLQDNELILSGTRQHWVKVNVERVK